MGWLNPRLPDICVLQRSGSVSFPRLHKEQSSVSEHGYIPPPPRPDWSVSVLQPVTVTCHSQSLDSQERKSLRDLPLPHSCCWSQEGQRLKSWGSRQHSNQLRPIYLHKVIRGGDAIFLHKQAKLMCQLRLHNKSVCARNCIYTSGPSVLKRKFQLTTQIALSHLRWRTQFQAEVPPALHNLLVRKRKVPASQKLAWYACTRAGRATLWPLSAQMEPGCFVIIPKHSYRL